MAVFYASLTTGLTILEPWEEKKFVRGHHGTRIDGRNMLQIKCDELLCSYFVLYLFFLFVCPCPLGAPFVKFAGMFSMFYK